MSSPYTRAVVALLLGLATGAACMGLLESSKDTVLALGLVFAVAAVAVALLDWRPGLWRTCAMVVLIGAAWPMAYFATITVHNVLYDAKTGPFVHEDLLVMRLALQTGNLIGGTLTVAALGLAARCWPSLLTVLRTLVLGGIICWLTAMKTASNAADVTMLLLPLWQGSILFSAVLGLDRRRVRLQAEARDAIR
jgi:hypothetical protein